MIAAGELKDIVTIERQAGLLDNMGQRVPTWGVLVRGRRAGKTPVRDSERIAAAQQGRLVTDRFLLRWEPRLVDLGAGDRLWLKRESPLAPLLYDITGVKEARGYRVGIEITANAQPDTQELPSGRVWF